MKKKYILLLLMVINFIILEGTEKSSFELITSENIVLNIKKN